MSTLLQDVRFGLRMLAGNLGFTAVAVLTLALAIGVNAIVFSAVNMVLLRPLPYLHPEQLVLLFASNPTLGVQDMMVPASTFMEWRDNARSFAGMGAFASEARNLSGTDTPERAQVTEVTANLLPLLGVEPDLGRGFLPEEGSPGRNRLVLVSHAFWTGHLGANPDWIGRSVKLDGETFALVGVMPEGFQIADDPADFWTPMVPQEKRDAAVKVIARLKPGRSPLQANLEMAALCKNSTHNTGPAAQGWTATVYPLRQYLGAGVSQTFIILQVIVAFVLLIACFNVANIYLARATTRSKELALRTALGASRLRILRLLLTESVVVALAGGGIGIMFALWGKALLEKLMPEIPGIQILLQMKNLSVDWRVLGFTLLISLFAGLLVGIAPALLACRSDLMHAIKEDTTRSSAGTGSNWLRKMLMAGELALALMLLAGGGLLLKSFLRLQQAPLGFDPRNVLTGTVTLPNADPREPRIFYDQLIRRLQGLPGVQAVGAVNILPQTFANTVFGMTSERDPRAEFLVEWRIATPEYFRAMGVSLLKGRTFSAADDAHSTRVAVINAELAHRLWPGDDPINKVVKTQDGGSYVVVGVVNNVRHRILADFRAQMNPQLYVPLSQAPDRGIASMTLAARTANSPLTLADGLRTAVRQEDSNLAIGDLRTMEQVMAVSVSPARFVALLMGGFALLALGMGMAGVYAVTSRLVANRRQEFGIRMALGARSGDILMMVLKEGFVVIATGMAAGMAGAWALTRLLTILLYGVKATDSSILISASILLCGAALLACILPARRATKVDPMVALRYE